MARDFRTFAGDIQITGRALAGDIKLKYVFTTNLPKGADAGYDPVNNILILPKVNPGAMNEDEARKYHCFDYHERKHHALSDVEVCKGNPTYGQTLRDFCNILEDARIELNDEYHVIGDDEDQRWYRIKEFHKHCDEWMLNGTMNPWGYLMHSLLFELLGYGVAPMSDQLQPYHDSAWEILQDGRFEAATKQRRQGHKVTLQLAKEILAKWNQDKKNDKSDEKEEGEGDGEGESENEDSDDKDKERKSGKGKGKGKKSKDKPDKEEKKEKNSGKGESEKKNDDGSDDEDSDGGSKGDDPKDKKDQKGKGQGKDKKDDSEESQGDKEDEGEGDGKGKDEEEDKEDGDGEGGDKDEDGDGDADKSPKTPPKNFDPSKTVQEEYETAQNSGDEAQMMAVDTLMEFIKEFFKQIENERNPKFRMSHVPDCDTYIPFNAHDRTLIAPMHQNEYTVIYNEISARIAWVRAQLTQFLQAESQSRLESNLKRGKLHSRSFYKLALGSERLFSKKFVGKSLSSAVQIVIDLSGSMQSCGSYENGHSMTRAQLAAQCSILFGEVLNALHVPFEIIGYNASDPKIEDKDFAKKSGFTRHSDIVNRWVFKAFNEDFHAVKYRMGSCSLHMPYYEDNPLDPNLGVVGGCNVDHEVILWGAARLAKRQEKRRIQIVLADGLPSGCNGGNYGGLLDTELLKANQRIIAAGMEQLAFGMCCEGVKNFYKKCIVLQNLNDLNSEALKLLAQTFWHG